MEENKNLNDKKQDHGFLNEQIKKVPIDKKRAVFGLIWVAVAAIVFGVIAGYVMHKVTEKLDVKEEIPAITISGGDDESEEETEPDISSGDETDESGDSEGDPVYITEKKDMSLADYQRLLDELHGVGRDAAPSVALITSTKSAKDWYDNDYQTEGQGSGIIITENQYSYYIVTEKKLISDAEQIVVSFYNEASATGQMIAYDGTTGIAVVRVDKSEFSANEMEGIVPIEIGSSGAAATGKLVIAIGSPLGEAYSVLTGNIIASNEYISVSDANYKILSTDIASTANASGALIDIHGKLIGLIVQDFGRSDNSNTLTVLAIQDIKYVIEKLSNGNSMAYLGVEMSTVTEQIANQYSMPLGVYIKSVDQSSPASDAGLQPGDVIVKVNQTEIKTYQEYQKWILDAAVGQNVSLTVKRMGSNGRYEDVVCNAVLGQVK